MITEENGDNITITDLYNLIKNTQLQNCKLHKEGREEIKEEITKLKTEITKELSGLKQENERLKEENIKLKTRILTTERKLKKYNLVVYGLDCEPEDTLQAVLTIVNENIHVRCNETNIRDIYQIGNKTEGKICPILIEFINYNLKTTILSNARNLKGTGIFISNDYTPEDYEKRKVLNKHLKLDREKQLSARIKNNKLIVNGEEYAYETLKNQEVIEETKPDESSSGTSKEEKTLQSTSAPPTPTQSNTFSLPFITQNDKKKRKQPESPNTDNKPKRERSSTRKQTTKKTINHQYILKAFTIYYIKY